MGSEKKFDLVILGSGSTAFAAALRAQELGKTALMTEERTLGGTCVNRGCLPSKNLIEAAKLLYDAQNPRYPGLRASRLGLDFKELISQKREVVESYRGKKYQSLLGGKFDLEKGHAEFLDPHTIAIGDRRVKGDTVLIATGSRPVLPRIEGVSDVPFLTNDLLSSGEPMELAECPHSLLVVGGGYIALELGQMFRRFGAEVTLLERSDQLFAQGYEPEVGPTVRKFLEEEGIRVETRALVRAVRREGTSVVATADVQGKMNEFRAEQLLIATGRRPNTDNIAVEQSGVKLGKEGQVLVDEHLRTNLPHIFAAGDVIGREVASQMATPVGSQDGGIAAHNALSGKKLRGVNHRVIPRVVFTDPPIAVVGMTEAEAVAAGHPCWCRAVPMSLIPRAGAIRDTKGFVKMGCEFQDRRGAGSDHGWEQRSGGDSRGGDGAAVPGQAARLYRPDSRLPDDGRGAQDCSHFPLQGSREAIVLRGMSAVEPRSGESKVKMKTLIKQFAGIIGAGVAAACCLGISVVLTAVGAAGLGFLVRDPYLFPIFAAFVAFSLWMLYRSARSHQNLAPFWLSSAGGAISMAGLWLLVTGLYAASWAIYLGLAVLVAGTIWDVLPGRKPVVCACEAPAVKKEKPDVGKRVATGAALSVAAAAAFYGMYKSVAVFAREAKEGEIACWGVNSCKGTTACTTAFNACTGQNDCKGRGYLNVPAKECRVRGGVPLKGSEADPAKSG